MIISKQMAAILGGLFIARVVAYCGHISPDWRASAEAAEQVFINAGIECLFMFEGA